MNLNQKIKKPKLGLLELAKSLGSVHQIGGQVYDQMHFNQLLAKKRNAKMLRDLVLARMVRPDSKKGIVEYCCCF